MATTLPSLDPADPKTPLTHRRLTLAKELFLHGSEHAERGDPLSKMIAIHNFHNAVEIALKAVHLYYGVRTAFNVGFEVMLSDLESHPPFREAGIKVPERAELFNLNVERNQVQHHAAEPPNSAVDYWKVMARKCLRELCQLYFGLDFESVSRRDMISDLVIRELIGVAEKACAGGHFAFTVSLLAHVFRQTSRGLETLRPPSYVPRWRSQSRGGRTAIDDMERRIAEVVEALQGRIEELQGFVLTLASGVAPMDYRRASRLMHQNSRLAEDAEWLLQFTTDSIIHWQATGLKPAIDSWRKEGLIELATQRERDDEKQLAAEAEELARKQPSPDAPDT